MKKLICGLVVFLAIAGALAAKKKKPAAAKANFDYYMLVLSYAPDFCDQTPKYAGTAECAKGNHTGFVVHGLWPQGENARGPENCGGGQVSPANLALMRGYIPTDDLVNHEWTSHGTCSGLSQDDYFALVKKARDSVKIPDPYSAPTAALTASPKEFASKFAAANPSDPPTAFRASCYTRSKELQEARVCFTKDLAARACGQSAGTCPVSQMTILPTR